MDLKRAKSFLTKDGKISHRKLRRAVGGRKARVKTKVAAYRANLTNAVRVRSQVQKVKMEVLKALRSA